MLRIGTCSWKYDSWKGLVYPELDKINFLEEYSKHFNTVEIDQWFWSLFDSGKVVLPKTSVAFNYAESVPDDFKFTIKMPNSLTLTHYYKSDKPNANFLNPELHDAFLHAIEPLHAKIGVLMFQFEYLNKQKMSNINQFLEKIHSFVDKADKRFKIGIETRNPNYLTKPFFEMLKELNLSMVFLEGYYMPPIVEVYNQHKEEITSPIVIRLHGPDRSGIEEKTKGSWNQIVEPKDESLIKIIEMIRDLQAKEIGTYVNVNNHFEGSAPLTINKIINGLKGNS
jgi:uncharacterized protein YecE (DUF72 family)